MSPINYCLNGAQTDQISLKKEDFNFMFLNIRSLRANGKLDDLKSYIDKFENIHVICLVETWLNSGDIPFFSIPGFNSVHLTRPDSMRGGGISCFIKDGVQCLGVITTGIEVQLVALKLKISLENLNLRIAYNPSLAFLH